MYVCVGRGMNIKKIEQASAILQYFFHFWRFFIMLVFTVFLSDVYECAYGGGGVPKPVCVLAKIFINEKNSEISVIEEKRKKYFYRFYSLHYGKNRKFRIVL